MPKLDARAFNAIIDLVGVPQSQHTRLKTFVKTELQPDKITAEEIRTFAEWHNSDTWRRVNRPLVLSQFKRDISEWVLSYRRGNVVMFHGDADSSYTQRPDLFELNHIDHQIENDSIVYAWKEQWSCQPFPWYAEMWCWRWYKMGQQEFPPGLQMWNDCESVVRYLEPKIPDFNNVRFKFVAWADRILGHIMERDKWLVSNASPNNGRVPSLIVQAEEDVVTRANLYRTVS